MLKQVNDTHRPIIINQRRTLYRISELKVYVLLVIDYRQNVEDILLQRLIRKN